MRHFCYCFIACLCAMVYSCTSKDEVKSPSDSKILKKKSVIEEKNFVPTSPIELCALSKKSDKVIDYRVARWIASAELIAGVNKSLTNEELYKQGWSLSRYPRVVYNYDNSPKYYEFEYVVDDETIAYITTYAQKEIDGVVAFVFMLDQLSFPHADMDYYIGNYPYRYFGKNGICYLSDSEEEIQMLPVMKDVKTDYELMVQMQAMMSEEDRKLMELDQIEQGEQSTLAEEQKIIDDYWEKIDAVIKPLDEILQNQIENTTIDVLYNDEFVNNNYSHKELDTEVIEWLLEELDYAVGYYDTFTLPEYTDPRLQLTRWQRYCGPAACSWVFRGKFDRYNGYYIPYYGDGSKGNFCDYYGYAFYKYSDINVKGLDVDMARDVYIHRSLQTDHGLAACFYKECSPLWWNGEWTFPLYHGGMCRGMKEATDGKYKVTFTCKPNDWIKKKHEPLIIGIDCDHYIAAFGVGTTHKKNGKVKDKYFMVTDNGATTSDTGYHPYMRRHSVWNLHYGLTAL